MKMYPHASDDENPGTPTWALTLTLALAIVVLALDLAMPLGVAGGVPYVTVVLMGIWFSRPFYVYALALLASALTVFGYFMSPEGGNFWVIVTNRGLALYAIWITALLIASRKRYEDQLLDTRNGLEDRVAERTKELKESETRFRVVTESARDAIISSDTDGLIIQWNQGARKMFGYEAPEIIGQSTTTLMPEDYREAHTKGFKRFMAGRGELLKSGTFEAEGLRKDGSKFPIEFVLFDWQIEKRKFVSCIIRDITKRKQTDKILSEKMRELDFQKYALDEHAIVSITDIKGSITYANDKFCKISGFSRKDLLGQNHRILKSDEHPQEFFTALWKTIANGEVWRGNIKNQRKDGSYYWVDATIVPFLNDQGKPFQYVAIRTDITVLIEAEKELAKSQTRFEVMAESSPNIMAIVRFSDGKVIYCNSAAKYILGKTSDEIVGTDASDYYSNRTDRDSMLKQLKKDGILQNYETQFQRADGTLFWISLNSQLAQLEGETFLFSEVTDISNRKRAEQQLEHSEHRFRDFSETASDWTWETDADHKVSFLSGKFLEQEGFTHSYLMGKTRQDLIGERNIALDPGKWIQHQKDLDNHRPFQDFEYVIHDKTGKQWQFQISGKPTFRADGKFSGFRGTGMDITEKKEMERVLHIAKEEAEAANRAKSEFISSMSHELRTPMNAILGFAQMLDFNPREPLSKTQKTSVNHILKGGQHLLELINEILDLARIEAGKIGLSIEDVPPWHILDDCLMLTTAIADQRGIDIFIPDAPVEGLIVRADHTRFKQVLLNLMSNAVKYNRENGTVTITFKETNDNMLHIAITDTGEGISEDKQTELFKPFSRLGAENTVIEGTGIGLVVCKNLIEAMNGAIGLESKIGKGSTFWIELPLSNSDHDEADETSDGKMAQVDEKIPDLSGTLLYIEDNPANLQLMELIVERIEGFSMISANTGEQGIELAKAKKPDLIILDINLPGINGLEVLKKLRSYNNTRNIPVLALSAVATKKDIDKGMQAGFLQYLTKPIEVPVVIDAIKTAVEEAT